MPITRSTTREQNIAPYPFTSGTMTTQLVSPTFSLKGRQTQPSPATLNDSHRLHERAVSLAYTSAIRNDNASTLMFSQPTPPSPDGMPIRTYDKDEEIRKLRQELEDLRGAFYDAQESKTALAKEVHRLHQSTTEEAKLFAEMDVRDGRGDSRSYQEMLKTIGLKEIPVFLPLPVHYVRGQVVDIPPVVVMGDRIEANGITIRFEEPIGAGGNGKVVGGTILDRNTEVSATGPLSVAIKATMKSGVPPWDEELFCEGRALRILGDRGLAPKLLAIVETPLRFLILMERYPMSLWDLEEVLRKESGPRGVDIGVIQIFAKGMALLLDGLHAIGQVHRDFKPGNVLIKETGEMVLVDFGSIGAVGGMSDDFQFGTPGFTAPFLKQPNTEEKNEIYQDLWSLGATLLWMAGRDLVCEGPLSEKECQKAIESCFPIATQPLAHSFLSKCLAFPAKGPSRKRLTAKAALKHPWLKEVVSTEIQGGSVIAALGALLTIPQEKLSLIIRRAAESMQKSLVDNMEPYYLNIGEGPCHELIVN